MLVRYAKTDVAGSRPVTEKPALALFQAERALDHITGLSVDWNEIGAEPPNKHAYDMARSVLSCIFMVGLQPTLVTASVASGVGICFRRGNIYADFECFNTGEITSSMIDSTGRTFSWEVNEEPGEVISAVHRIQQTING